MEDDAGDGVAAFVAVGVHADAAAVGVAVDVTEEVQGLGGAAELGDRAPEWGGASAALQDAQELCGADGAGGERSGGMVASVELGYARCRRSSRTSIARAMRSNVGRHPANDTGIPNERGAQHKAAHRDGAGLEGGAPEASEWPDRPRIQLDTRGRVLTRGRWGRGGGHERHEPDRAR